MFQRLIRYFLYETSVHVFFPHSYLFCHTKQLFTTEYDSMTEEVTATI